MALHWDWKERCGEVTLSQKQEDGTWKDFPLRLYTGNCCLIMLSEDDEKDTYALAGFFADVQHMKNCLGLNKKDGYGDNIYNTEIQRITKLRLNKSKARYWKDIITAFSKAFDNLTIELFTEVE